MSDLINASIARYLRALDRADREDSDIAEAKSVRLKEKIAGLRQQMNAVKADTAPLRAEAHPRQAGAGRPEQGAAAPMTGWSPWPPDDGLTWWPPKRGWRKKPDPRQLQLDLAEPTQAGCSDGAVTEPRRTGAERGKR